MRITKRAAVVGLCVGALLIVGSVATLRRSGRFTPDEYAKFVDERFRAESSEPSSRALEATLRERLRKFPVTLRLVECRLTMCRMEIASMSAREDFMREAFVVPASVWEGPLFVVPAGLDDEAVIFVARPGYELPKR